MFDGDKVVLNAAFRLLCSNHCISYSKQSFSLPQAERLLRTVAACLVAVVQQACLILQFFQPIAVCIEEVEFAGRAFAASCV